MGKPRGRKIDPMVEGFQVTSIPAEARCVYEVFDDETSGNSHGIFSSYVEAAHAVSKLVVKQADSGLKPTRFNFEIVEHTLNVLR